MLTGHPTDETSRLQALRATGLLDSPPEDRFDRIVRLAARLLDVPMALVSLVDAERVWLKASYGVGPSEIPRAHSFCTQAIQSGEPLVVQDASRDPRFAANVLVTGEPHVRFYAGVPVAAPGGEPLGTLCIADTEPRVLRPQDLATLVDLGRWVETEISAGDAGLAHDARRRSDEQRDELRRLEERLLRAAAHELRTPLTVVFGHVQLLAMEVDTLTPAQAESVGEINRAALRLEGITEKLLADARADSPGAHEALVERLGDQAAASSDPDGGR